MLLLWSQLRCCRRLGRLVGAKLSEQTGSDALHQVLPRVSGLVQALGAPGLVSALLWVAQGKDRLAGQAGATREDCLRRGLPLWHHGRGGHLCRVTYWAGSLGKLCPWWSPGCSAACGDKSPCHVGLFPEALIGRRVRNGMLNEGATCVEEKRKRGWGWDHL